MPRLLLAGYFGSGNLGDDAIMMGFVEALRDKPYEMRVIAGSPERLMRNNGIVGVPKTDMGAIKNALEDCDALVFPGGSIFQDVTSTRSVMYYANLVDMAKKAGKKVILLGQGIGPLTHFLGKRFAVAAFNKADVIAVRDPASVATLKALGYKGTPRVTADMAFLLPKPTMPAEGSSFGVANMKTVGVSCRPVSGDKNIVKVFGDLVRLLYQANYVPVMLPMDEVEDRKLLDEIAKAHGGKVPELKGISTPKQMQERIMRMEGVIGMRLHAGILAATVDVPAYMVSYDPKVNAFANLMGFPAPLSVQGVTAQRIFDGFQAFIKDRDKVAASLERRRAELSTAAMANIQLLDACFGK
ncbi:MAG: polysaccharide pyruvyl transferase CsaB [Armatimonadetes bacterium]|nr:polysaccharide pyruvyl transferase CsaB [Armatimonadota bacterium]